MAKKYAVRKYILSKKKKICELADKILEEMDEKIEDAPLNQLASVLGTLLDKFGSDEKDENSEGILSKVFEDFEDVV